MEGADAATAAFLADMPTMLRTHLDFINNFLIVLLTFCLRALGALQEKHVAGMQFLTFTLCLPAVSLVVAWSAQIERSTIVVLALSAITHTVWVSAVVFALGITRAKQKAMYFMSTTACAMAFVYPVVLQSDRFGANAAAIVLLWDFGGNLAVCWLFQGIAARRYAPALTKETLSVGEAKGSLEKCTEVQAKGSEVQEKTVCHCADVDVEQGEPSNDEKTVTEQSSEISDSRTLEEAETQDTADSSALLEYLRYAGMAVKNPVLMAAAVGLLLNMARVPMYPLPARAVESLMGAFPPLLYSFVGANLRFNLGKESYSFIAKALFSRWTICATVAMAGRVLWPVDEQTRGVLTLCMAAPATAALIMWCSHFSYPLEQASMVWNISAVVSLIVMSIIAPVV